jgi:hypothetical protein
MSDDFEYEIVDPLGPDYNPEPSEVPIPEEEEDDQEETV